jgi:ureidoglycolate hydrolase
LGRGNAQLPRRRNRGVGHGAAVSCGTPVIDVVTLTPLPLTESSIADCGEFLGPKERIPDFAELASRGWAVDFKVSGRTQLMFLKTDYVGTRFTELESHLNVSQAFIHTGGSAAFVAVAPPSATPPKPDQMRALRIEPGMGYVLKIGAWHSLDRHPLAPPGSTFVMVTGEETTQDLIVEAVGHRRHTITIDYQARFQVAFDFVI